MQSGMGNHILEQASGKPLPFLPSDLLGNNTFASIVAQDMVLEEEYQCLPPVILDEDPSTEQTSSLSPTTKAFAALAARTYKLAHLDIRLDW